MEKPVAIVTGSSSGFGLLTTIELAKSGFHVIATMRNLAKSDCFQLVTNDVQLLEKIEVYQLDVSDGKSIEALKAKVDSLERVDVLVNNAGFGMGGFAENIPVDEFRRQFETNVFGAMAVTQVVLPKMRLQKSGKIIQVSSISGRMGFPGLSPYVSSKYALAGYSESLRHELQPFGIQVALVEPGSYNTNIWTSGMEIIGEYGEDSAYQQSLQAILASLETSKPSHGNPMEVAELICKLARMKKIKSLHYPIGKGIKASLLAKSLLPWRLWEKAVASVLNRPKKN